MKTNGLTVKQQKFVKYVTEGHTPANAAALAGYTFPEVNGSRLKQNENVQKEIYSRQMAALTAELLPKSLRRIDDILDDMSAAPAGIKLKAAQYVIDKATELQAMASARDIADKNPLDMTVEELEIFVMRGRIVLKQERAKQELGIIEHEPA